MRKWMRERLKRRQKRTDQTPAEGAPAPLQPAFYDTEPAAPVHQESQAVTEPQFKPAAETPPSEPVGSQPEDNRDMRRGRRRRGRGGRGRGTAAIPQTSGSATVQAESQPAASSQAARLAPAPPEEVTGVRSPAVPIAPPRPSRGTVVLAIGLPGSGKSSWFKRHEITPLSSDLLRALLFDDPTEQRFQDLIFSNLRSMLKARLIARRPMNYVDATNLSPHDRRGWIKLAKDYGYDVQAVFFDVPVEVCLERNRRRERVVPEDVMRRMAGKLKQPTFEEGFSKITVVRVKQKD